MEITVLWECLSSLRFGGAGNVSAATCDGSGCFAATRLPGDVRPATVISYSNGYEHWIWDNVNYPPRPVQGFYKKSELGKANSVPGGSSSAGDPGGRQNLSGSQIEFLNMIIDHLAKHGLLDPAQLDASRFTDIASSGPEGLFGSDQVDRLIEILAQVRSTAIATAAWA